jgi:predicted SprT family Zn-dependent metalloprotease
MKEKLLDVAKNAMELMYEHGLLARGWKFGFNSSKISFGTCDFVNKTITLSYSVSLCNVNDNMDVIIDTIIHEIAHALAYIRYKSALHCDNWRKIFIKIGGNGKTTVDANDINVPSYNYEYECPVCNGKLYRYNKVHGIACTDCCDKNNVDWDEKYVYRLKMKLKSIDRVNEC